MDINHILNYFTFLSYIYIYVMHITCLSNRKKVCIALFSLRKDSEAVALVKAKLVAKVNQTSHSS